MLVDQTRQRGLLATLFVVMAILAVPKSSPSAVEPSKPKILIYYWPFVARISGLVHMCDEVAADCEHISDKASLENITTTPMLGDWTLATSDTFAPPIVVHGDFRLSQSIAAFLYVGNLLGFNSNVEPYKAIQYMGDLNDFLDEVRDQHAYVDTDHDFESGGEFFATRFKAWMGTFERSIAGPFYFGAERSMVDYFCVQVFDWAEVRTRAARNGEHLLALILCWNRR